MFRISVAVIRRAVAVFCVAPVAVSIGVPLLVVCGSVSAGPSTIATTGNVWQIEGMDTLPPAEIERQLPNANPLNYFLYAGRLFKDGESDKAVFWYHAGELRFKFLLLAHPSPPDAGQALFESMQASVGQPISLYAGSDTKRWVDQINAVLQWDASTPNGFTSKTEYRRQWEDARSWLVKVRGQILAHADEIQKQRAKQDINHIKVENGVYIEEHRPKMPADWPALAAATPVDRVVGAYKADFRLGHTLFLGEGQKALRATTFDVSREGSDGVLIVAKSGEDELIRRTMSAREQDGAVIFEADTTADNLREGRIHETVYLRLNAVGDLVVQSDWLTEGYRNKTMPIRESNTFWFRTERLSKIEMRVTPPGFESEARFLELLRNSDSSVHEIKVENAPQWDIAALAEYFSESGLDLTDVNFHTHDHADVGSILASLKARKGRVFFAFSRLSNIYSTPYKQYSELHFSSTSTDTSIVDVSTWYRLTFKRTSAGPKLITLDYLERLQF
jgi:hypothetical protein